MPASIRFLEDSVTQCVLSTHVRIIESTNLSKYSRFDQLFY